MKLRTALLLILGAATSIAANENPPLEIIRHGSQPPQKASAANFTGSVQIEGTFDRKDPARVSGATVTFQSGARTAWHTHPLGQTLIVTAGEGWVQREGGPRETIRPGDIVWIPPGVKHWHGATSTGAMTHLAITESLDGIRVQWLEQVSDQQYYDQEPMHSGK